MNTSSPESSRRVLIVGDIHGQLERLAGLLYHAGLISTEGVWTGGTTHLWFVGDFVDRGPHGLDTIGLAIRLQQEAAAAGGLVDAVLGNHDLLLLGVIRFQGLFLANHKRNGGNPADLRRIRPEHERWLSERPAMARLGDTLLLHADSTGYLHYGRTVTQVNRTIADILQHPDAATWDQLLERLSERLAFDTSASGSTARLVTFLATYGARRLVHGHTPISYMTGRAAQEILAPHVYAQGRCINVDGGLYMGSPGFLFQLDAPADAEPQIGPSI